MTPNRTTITITKEQIALLPVVVYSGVIEVINTAEQAKKAIEEISDSPIVGFDTETKPSFRKGRTNQVALIQISTETKCYLFRINRFGMTKEIIGLFENPSITKVGLSTKDDFLVLHKIQDFTPQNFVELQSFVRDYMIADSSLQKIFGIIFNQRISKSQRLTNWEAESLTEHQQAYASIDAWACLKIYNHLISGLFDPMESPYAHEAEELVEVQ